MLDLIDLKCFQCPVLQVALKEPQLLCISTSLWVLREPKAGWNLFFCLFSTFSVDFRHFLVIFCCVFRQAFGCCAHPKGEKALKWTKKVEKRLKKMFRPAFGCVQHPKLVEIHNNLSPENKKNCLKNTVLSYSLKLVDTRMLVYSTPWGGTFILSFLVHFFPFRSFFHNFLVNFTFFWLKKFCSSWFKSNDLAQTGSKPSSWLPRPSTLNFQYKKTMF